MHFRWGGLLLGVSCPHFIAHPETPSRGLTGAVTWALRPKGRKGEGNQEQSGHSDEPWKRLFLLKTKQHFFLLENQAMVIAGKRRDDT